MSSVLPTIKCSMCSQDIPISRMGEHICGASSAAERECTMGNYEGLAGLTNMQRCHRRTQTQHTKMVTNKGRLMVHNY
jgi:hypothetical protein